MEKIELKDVIERVKEELAEAGNPEDLYEEMRISFYGWDWMIYTYPLEQLFVLACQDDLDGVLSSITELTHIGLDNSVIKSQVVVDFLIGIAAEVKNRNDV